MAPNPESSLLLTLGEISQLIAHCHQCQETLSNVVRLLASRFGTEVCSVYLLEPNNRELVLAETVGLRPDSVGRIRMHLNEGLTGLVAERASPVMVQEATSHPRFKFFPESGEEAYHSFLGVPLFDGGRVNGVLVLQTKQARDFSLDEVRMLITAASQLSPLVGEAWALAQVGRGSATGGDGEAEPASSSLSGVALSPGVGVGAAYWAKKFDWTLLSGKADDPARERRRLDTAMELARQDTERVNQHVASLLGEDEGGILQAQLLILQDAQIMEVLNGFLAEGASAEAAVLRGLEHYTRKFERIANVFFRERLYDVKDAFRRILWHLQPRADEAEAGDGKLVLVSEEASVAELFSVDLDQLAGIVVEQGGWTSHAAILARSLGIPMLAQVQNLRSAVHAGARLLVDGDQAVLVVQPSDALLAEHKTPPSAPIAVGGRSLSETAEPVPEPPLRPLVEANINLVSEVHQALAQGVAGVGLYRTEFLILSRRAMVGEEAQVRNYRQLLTLLAGRPASIRTFDLRAEKAPPPSADQPDPGSLDWRLVLRSPAVQRVFKQQVRAILRAGVAGPVRILVPLVVSTEQLLWVQQAIAEARDELQRDGLPIAEHVPLGIMIEVPAAAMMVEEWAGRVDFLCLGTNDLLSGAMGVSRDDPVAAEICDPLHPGLLRLVQQVIQAGRAAGKPVTVCGEMAGHEQGARLLAEMGADALSVAVESVARVRKSLAQWAAQRAQAPPG